MVENNIDKAAMELSELLPILQQKLIKPFEQLSKNKIGPIQFHLLFILEEKGILSMTELSKELLISKQQTTPIVDKLIKLGLVKRKHNKEDRRVINISLSLSGRQYIEKIKIDIYNLMKNKFHNLNDDDLNKLYKAFNQIKIIVNKLP